MVQLVKGGFSYRARKELGFGSEIWQRGFADPYIARARGFEVRKQEIRGNPVEARLAASEEEYPYSSAHPGFVLDPMPSRRAGSAAKAAGTRDRC